MATDAVQRQPLPRTRHVSTNRTRERIFFAIMALLVVTTILLGFRASYVPLGERPAALGNLAIILHAAVFTLFLLRFAVQTTLIAAHRVRWHMQLGLWLYGLAALMVPFGAVAAIDELRPTSPPAPPPSPASIPAPSP
jgi:high-affinity K+ transport system ATPase subunit B